MTDSFHDGQEDGQGRRRQPRRSRGRGQGRRGALPLHDAHLPDARRLPARRRPLQARHLPHARRRHLGRHQGCRGRNRPSRHEVLPLARTTERRGEAGQRGVSPVAQGARRRRRPRRPPRQAREPRRSPSIRPARARPSISAATAMRKPGPSAWSGTRPEASPSATRRRSGRPICSREPIPSSSAREAPSAAATS